ncbi:unnamed protein product [Rotaria magnacalcarata]|uniref:RNA-dependent RNA polymerase n=1 Tax=Rotaria magnacalcarata TaxID=392030 RepID=A0A816MD21_9BILA|nr:unnamed protein product [Rotaria magnacalcarata]
MENPTSPNRSWSNSFSNPYQTVTARYALEILHSLSHDIYPAAYQIRMASCKGLVFVELRSILDQFYIKISPSMKKFGSSNCSLDICKTSEPNLDRYFSPYPEDMLVLEAVDSPELYCLTDVIVFSTKRERSDPNKVAGSDLDGDLS